MALKHARPGQPIDLAPLGDALPRTATHAILKTHALELIRVVLRAGEALPPHRARGELTLYCIEGSVALRVDEERDPLQHDPGAADPGEPDPGPASSAVVTLRTGQLVLLAAQCPHDLRALDDCSLLLTLQLPAGEPGSASSTQP